MLVIGHRGAPARAPENTLPSFHAAITAGADGLECDVRMTADGGLVVMHDDDVARTTAAAGRISEMTLAEARALDAGRARGSHEPLQVPKLAEVLALETPLLVLELKGSMRDGVYHSAVPVARAVVDAIGARAGIVVSSFDPAAVAEVRTIASHVPTALGVLPGSPPEWAIDAASAAGHAECHVSQSRVDPAFVARAHDAGLRVLVFTVNDIARAQALEAMGVDGIFTDDPEAMLASREAGV